VSATALARGRSSAPGDGEYLQVSLCRRPTKSPHEAGNYVGAGAIQQAAQHIDCKWLSTSRVSVLPPKLPPKVCDARPF